MTSLARGRKTGRGVRRIVGAVVVVLVATDARCIRAGQVVVAVHVTLLALQRGVEAGQREAGSRVVKCTAAPGGRRVARLAGCGEAHLGVIGAVRIVVIGLVTTDAGGVRAGQAVVAAEVALRALQGRVRASQREAGGRVIERAAAPGCSGVAVLACGGELRLRMVRIGGAVVVRQMATGARRVGAGQVIVAVDMALRAEDRKMRAGQREAGGGMIEAGIPPVGRAVTLLASLRQVGLHVIGFGRALVVVQVASDAGCASQVVVVVDVTLRAGYGRVSAGKGKYR